MATLEELDRDLVELARSLQAIVAAGRLLDNRLSEVEERLERLERRPGRDKLVTVN